MNNGMEQEPASLSYMSIDDVVASILEVGKGSRLAKMDIRQAYRHIPFHLYNRDLLGMCWRGEYGWIRPYCSG